MENINFIAFGTFGSPNGFTQTFFLGKPFKGIKAFDIRGGLKILPNSKVYSIRKESVDGFNILSYSIYTFAQEPTSSRGGSFIGSSILYVDKIAKEHITIAQLNEFHSQLISKNVTNDTIAVNHSDKFSIVKPKDFDKIEFHLREIENLNFRQNTNNTLIVFCDINDNNLIQFFKRSIDLLNAYDTIYFTDSQEVAEFVHQKGIFKLIQNVGEKRDFEKEINTLIEERKRKREQSISEFERELERINEDKNQTIKEFKNQIEQSERTHLENDIKIKESKEDINKIGQFYDDFLNKTKNLINQLRHNNGKLEEVKQIHNSNKVLFNSGISDLKRPNYTTIISKPKPKGNLHTENQWLNNEYRNGQRRGEEREETEEKAYKIDIFKVLTLVLAFLLIVTWVYFLFFKSNAKNETEIFQNQEQINTMPQEEEKSVETKLHSDLSPVSNKFLNENDYRIVARSLTPNIKLEDVVKVIFNKNPTEIGNIYSGQEANYSKHLLERNKQCFEEKDGIYYFAKDTLRQIPSYKK